MAISERKKQPFKVLHRIALEKAREIHESPIEKLYSIDEYGDCYYAEGDAEEVQPTQTMIERGVIDVHNHPHNLKIFSTLSRRDIEIFLEQTHKIELIVCGYGEYCWIRRGNCRVNSSTVSEQILNISNQVLNTTISRFPKQITKKEFRLRLHSEEENMTKQYNKKLAAYVCSIGLSYGRTKL